MVRRRWLLAGLAGSLALGAWVVSAQETRPARLSVVVVDPQGRPLAGVPLGACRMASLADLAPEALVRAEQTLTTGADGRVTLDVPPNTPGIDRVVVFTAAPDRANVILPAAPYQGQAPRLRDLQQPQVTLYDLRERRDPVPVTLAPAADDQRRTELVPMRDGVKLATDVHLPAGDGPWPVIVMRTPYGRAQRGRFASLTSRGYVVVSQDVRGRFASEGDNLPFVGCGWEPYSDGVDTAAWILKQPWCNGKIGSQGASAGGITQVLTAAAEPPGYACQAIGVCFGDMYRHAAYVGGAFCKSLLESWVTSNQFDPRTFELIRGHQAYDEYWQRFNADARAARVTLPGLFSGGWYDVFQQGTIDAFLARQLHGGPGARGRQKLVMGPWPHSQRATVGELTYPPNALRPPAPSEAQWFDGYLKGEANGVADRPTVVWYQMGACGEPDAPGNVWKTAASWPPESTPTPYYLHDDGRLATVPPAAAASKAYDYDPQNPVPTKGGNNLTIPAGPFDQRPIESRPDVLVFTSDPLVDPLAITGRVTAKLWVSSDAPDTDFTVKLTDVYPDGRSMLVLDGIRRMRFRNGFEQAQLLTPGEVYPVEVDLWSTSLVVNRGHRLRVAVSSSNAPRFEPNPNTAAGYWSGPGQVAHNTVFLGGQRPSQIILPVVAGR